jgi:hypothetical protein
LVAIGVTGHRKLNNVEQISHGVDEAISKIKDSFPNKDLTIISPLAEGADRLVVWRAMEQNDVHLVVPLPLDISEYMLDFKTISSRAEFVTLLEEAAEIIELPAMETREASYQAAGIYVLDNSDALIAVWDGKKAHGPGGTGHIIEQAREQKKPLAWIFAWNQVDSPSSPSLTNDAQGKVSYENFP